MQYLAQNVEALVRRAGGQEKLALQAGVSQSAISRWRSGRPPKALAKLEGLATYAGTSIDGLLTKPIASRDVDAAIATTAAMPSAFFLPVVLPSEARLVAMMRGLLRSVGLRQEADDHAETLARRLPAALASAAAELEPPGYDIVTTDGDRAQPLAKPRLS